MNLTWKNKSKTNGNIDSKNGTKKLVKKTKKFNGDGLILDLGTNERDIELIGDGCKLTVAVNSGKICVYGDGCSLKIENNSGYIEYRGDGGRVSLGAESSFKKIDYIGEGGKVDIGKDKKCAGQSSVTVENKNQGDLDIPHENFTAGEPSRKYNSPTISTKKRQSNDKEKNSSRYSTRIKNFDNFANEFIKSRNIDAGFDKQKHSEKCVRTTIKTVRIFYDNPHSVLPTKSRTRTKIVNSCSIDT